MRASRWMTALWLLSFVGVCGFLISVYLELPERFATQFDLSGRPISWSEKQFFAYLFLGAVSFSNILIGGITSVLSKTRRWDRWINMPYKAYWFGNPARKTQALSKIKTVTMGAGLFCNLISLFVLRVIYQENVVTASVWFNVTSGVYFILALSSLFTLATFWFLRPPRKQK